MAMHLFHMVFLSLPFSPFPSSFIFTVYPTSDDPRTRQELMKRQAELLPLKNIPAVKERPCEGFISINILKLNACRNDPGGYKETSYEIL